MGGFRAAILRHWKGATRGRNLKRGVGVVCKPKGGDFPKRKKLSSQRSNHLRGLWREIIVERVTS